mmetsp:Transcript_15444/g.22968  ORF Transcript_15444/g.22968 Transcript_15444/m.22968 type:complete len:408 (-) Transcript_15444:10-1233(-)
MKIKLVKIFILFYIQCINLNSNAYISQHSYKCKINNGVGIRFPLPELQMTRDLYDILGVNRNADYAEIKSSFKKLARRYHPDINPNGEEKFKEISNAYEILSNKEARQKYDLYGDIGLQNPTSGERRVDIDFADIFESFFGSSWSQRNWKKTSSQRGEDLRMTLDIDFKEACFGTVKKVSINQCDVCASCNGDGDKKGTKFSQCGQCRGNGVVIQVQMTPLGSFQTKSVCPSCNGYGQKAIEACMNCQGTGLKDSNKLINVRIPPGVDSQSKLRIQGEGNASNQGLKGDLIIFLNILPHPIFTRMNYDIYSEKHISYLDAILGNKSLLVEVVDGEVEIKIFPGTQHATILRIKGKGIPNMTQSGERGDHYISIKVEIPKQVKGEEKKLLEKLKSKGSKKRGFFGFFK